MPDAKPKPSPKEIYEALFRVWGPRGWWPARSRFEIMVGAILTQNTAWVNVTKAIRNLRAAGTLDPHSMHQLETRNLAALIRPAGTFNVKATRLRNYVNWLMERHGGVIDRMFATKTSELRTELLSINGIGKETADCILLYAGKRPVFVIDAYTRRILARHGWSHPRLEYDSVASFFIADFADQPERERALHFGEYHALLVELAKRHCRTRPDCAACPLKRWLPPGGPL